MKSLSEKEIKDLKEESFRNYVALTDALKENQILENNLKTAKKRYRYFLSAFAVSVGLFILTLVLFFVFYGDLFLSSFNSNQVIVNKTSIENYENKILQLKDSLRIQSAKHPLELDEFYTVQLGAFKNFETPLTSAGYKIISHTKYKDFNLFTLGVFETREEAEQLLKLAKELNFKDAFVDQYQNGVRVNTNSPIE